MRSYVFFFAFFLGFGPTEKLKIKKKNILHTKGTLKTNTTYANSNKSVYGTVMYVHQRHMVCGVSVLVRITVFSDLT